MVCLIQMPDLNTDLQGDFDWGIFLVLLISTFRNLKIFTFILANNLFLLLVFLQITKLLDLDHETGRRKWTIQCCNKTDRDSIKAGFDRLNKYLIEDSNSAKKSDESDDDFNKI